MKALKLAGILIAIMLVLIAPMLAEAATPSMMISDGKTINLNPGGNLDATTFLGRSMAITEYAAGTSRVTDTITCPDIAKYYLLLNHPKGPVGDDVTAQPSQYYLRVTQVDSGAAAEQLDSVLVGHYRIITKCYPNGRMVVTPGFDAEGQTAALDAGDKVEIVRFTDINPNSQTCYRGYVLSGSATTALFPDLIGRNGAIVKDSYIKCLVDEAGSDEGDLALVSAFNATTGVVTFTTGILTPTVDDYLEVVWTPMGEIAGGVNGLPSDPTGAFHGANVNTAEMLAFVQDSLRKVAALLDASAIQGFAVTVDYTSGTWNTAATHEVVNVTGDIEFWLTISDSTDITSTNASDSMRIQIATTATGGSTTLLAAFLAAGFDAGEQVPFLVAASSGPTVPAAGGLTLSAEGSAGAIRFHGISRSLDIGYEQVTAAGTGGLMRWFFQFRPVVPGSGATAAAGAGGTL